MFKKVAEKVVSIKANARAAQCRGLGFAANGVVNPEDALVLIALATIGYLAVLLTVSLFIAVLIVLVRWYKDSEMIVWFAFQVFRHLII